MRKEILIMGYLSCLLLLAQTGCAQVIDSLKLAAFSDAVLELQNSELMRHGTLSVCVKAVKDRSNVFALNQEKSLPSASILKLATTATVLSVLGGDFRYQTFLEYDGEIRRDTLFGNLFIRGTGDPSLGSDRFKDYPESTKLALRWVTAVKKAGIRYIKGNVTGDDAFFEGNTVSDSWIYADLGNYFGAGATGLNFNENLYRAKFKPGATTGEPAPLIGVEPPVPGASFSNFVSTGERGSGDQVIIYGGPLNKNVVLRGTVPSGFATFSVKGSLPDPAGFAAATLTRALQNTSVMLSDLPDSTLKMLPGNNKRRILDEYQSPPLWELCQQTNWWSINLYADAFLRLVGKRVAGKADYEGASEAIANHWRIRGADLRGFYIKDGSGLSPSGSLTTQNLTDILALETKENSFQDFYKGIARIGINGTVRNLAKGNKAVGNMRVKSGSIEGTRAFSGYVTTKSGAMLSFALIAHKYQPESGRIVSEELVRLMTLLAKL